MRKSKKEQVYDEFLCKRRPKEEGVKAKPEKLCRVIPKTYDGNLYFTIGQLTLLFKPDDTSYRDKTYADIWGFKHQTKVGFEFARRLSYETLTGCTYAIEKLNKARLEDRATYRDGLKILEVNNLNYYGALSEIASTSVTRQLSKEEIIETVADWQLDNRKIKWLDAANVAGVEESCRKMNIEYEKIVDKLRETERELRRVLGDKELARKKWEVKCFEVTRELEDYKEQFMTRELESLTEKNTKDELEAIIESLERKITDMQNTITMLGADLDEKQAVTTAYNSNVDMKRRIKELESLIDSETFDTSLITERVAYLDTIESKVFNMRINADETNDSFLKCKRIYLSQLVAGDIKTGTHLSYMSRLFKSESLAEPVTVGKLSCSPQTQKYLTGDETLSEALSVCQLTNDFVLTLSIMDNWKLNTKSNYAPSKPGRTTGSSASSGIKIQGLTEKIAKSCLYNMKEMGNMEFVDSFNMDYEC